MKTVLFSGLWRSLVAVAWLFPMIAWLLCCVQPVAARTVSIVLDDSGSMETKDRWIKANYVVQSFAALLDEKDQLYVYCLNSGENGRIYPLMRGKRTQSLKKIQKIGGHLGDTPYKAVQNAQAVFQKSSGMVGNFGEKSADWLIVVNDGAFNARSAADNAKTSPSEIDRIVRQDARNFFSSQAGKATKVAFVVIDPDNGNDLAANLWMEAAKDTGLQANMVVYQPESASLIKQMGELVKDISGRDTTTVKYKKSGRHLRFNSVFPLQRIAIFEQKKRGTPAQLQKATAPDGKPLPLSSFYIEAPKKKSPVGRVTHLLRSSILPAGKYDLQFNTDITGRNVQLILEPAVDFTVTPVEAAGGTPLQKHGGVFQGCIGDTVAYRVDFLQPGKAGSSLITASVEKQLSVLGRVDNARLKFTREQGRDSYLSKQVTVQQGKSSLEVESRYPGYFHIKSRAVVIEGRNCRKKAGITGGGAIPVPYTIDPAYQKVAEQQIGRINKTTNGPASGGGHTVHISGLPKGVQLKIKGKLITRDSRSAHIELQKGEKLVFDILRNNEFKSKKDVTLTVRLEADDKHMTYAETAEIVLKPEPRMVALLPDTGNWKAPFDRLTQTPGPHIALRVNGRPVDQKRFAGYHLSFSSEGKLGLEMVPDPLSSGYILKVSPYIMDCLTTVGRQIKTTLTVKGPYPGEVAVADVIFYVEPVEWWKMYWRCALRLVLLLVVLAWIIGCMRKRRFASRAAISYIRKNVLRDKKSRPDIFYLAGGKQRVGSKVAGFLRRWFWPFGAEQCLVEGLLFVAGRTGGAIFLSAKSQRENMELNYTPITHAGTQDIAMGTTAVLQVSGQNRIETYKYENN